MPQAPHAVLLCRSADGVRPRHRADAEASSLMTPPDEEYTLSLSDMVNIAKFTMGGLNAKRTEREWNSAVLRETFSRQPIFLTIAISTSAERSESGPVATCTEPRIGRPLAAKKRSAADWSREARRAKFPPWNRQEELAVGRRLLGHIEAARPIWPATCSATACRPIRAASGRPWSATGCFATSRSSWAWRRGLRSPATISPRTWPACRC